MKRSECGKSLPAEKTKCNEIWAGFDCFHGIAAYEAGQGVNVQPPKKDLLKPKIQYTTTKAWKTQRQKLKTRR